MASLVLLGTNDRDVSAKKNRCEQFASSEKLSN